MNNVHKKYNKKQFLLLWCFCIIGSWSIFPYIYTLGMIPPTSSILKIFLLTTVQAFLVYGIACYVSYKILPKTDLEPFKVKSLFKQVLLPGVIAGLLVGLVIFSFDKTTFQSSTISDVQPPFWAGAIASIYGGVNEEVLLRLFLFTLFYFIFIKLIGKNKNRVLLLWITNIIVSIIFGLGHLPLAFKLINPSSFEIFRILFLNGIPGIVFGWLYWSRGLWTAMLAHFVCDLMIHVFLI